MRFLYGLQQRHLENQKSLSRSYRIYAPKVISGIRKISDDTALPIVGWLRVAILAEEESSPLVDELQDAVTFVTNA